MILESNFHNKRLFPEHTDNFPCAFVLVVVPVLICWCSCSYWCLRSCSCLCSCSCCCSCSCSCSCSCVCSCSCSYSCLCSRFFRAPCARARVRNINWFQRPKQRKLKPPWCHSPFSVFFFQRSVDRTENEFWFNRCRRERVSIRETLGISPATTLNIYTCQFFIQTMIGHATLPWEYSESSLRHGVAIHHGTLPGGGMVTLDLGDNAVHEVIFYWSS